MIKQYYRINSSQYFTIFALITFLCEVVRVQHPVDVST